MSDNHPTIPAPPPPAASRRVRLANALRRLASDVQNTYTEDDPRVAELETFLWVQSKLDFLFPHNR